MKIKSLLPAILSIALFVALSLIPLFRETWQHQDADTTVQSAEPSTQQSNDSTSFLSPPSSIGMGNVYNEAIEAWENCSRPVVVSQGRQGTERVRTRSRLSFFRRGG
jgi:hypothetical protein